MENDTKRMFGSRFLQILRSQNNKTLGICIFTIAIARLKGKRYCTAYGDVNGIQMIPCIRIGINKREGYIVRVDNLKKKNVLHCFPKCIYLKIQ